MVSNMRPAVLFSNEAREALSGGELAAPVAVSWMGCAGAQIADASTS